MDKRFRGLWAPVEMEVLSMDGGLRMLMIGAPDHHRHQHRQQQVGACKIVTTPPRVLSLGPCSSGLLEERKRGSSRRGPMRRTAAASSSIDASPAAVEHGVNSFSHIDAEIVVHQKLQAAGVDRLHKLKIGIVGFGNFGQFLAERIRKQGHTVIAYSRGDYVDVARMMHVSYFRDANDFCEEHPDVVLLCTSIMSTEAVLTSLPMQRLKRNTLFVDVLSVKEFSKQLFLQVLPPEFDVLCTHPMFGPKSGKATWAGLPFVYDKVRIGDGARQDRCDKFLDIFATEGCRMVEIPCQEHDRFAAGSQFITHTVGRVLGKLQLESTPINTKGYETLLRLVENTDADSFELYYGLFMYNPNAIDELERLELAFDCLKKQLFGELHDILRKQLLNGTKAKNDEQLLDRIRAAPKLKLSKKTAGLDAILHNGMSQISVASQVHAGHSTRRMQKKHEKNIAGGAGKLNISNLPYEPLLCHISQLESSAESSMGRSNPQQSDVKNKVSV